MAKGSKAEMGFQNSANSKKNRKSVIASLDEEDQLVAHVKVDTQENGVLQGKGLHDVVAVEETPIKIKKSRKKRVAADMEAAALENLADNGHVTEVYESQIKDDVTEPTMGEKLASLNILDKSVDKSANEKVSNNQTKPPSADSMHILVRQALQADDRALLLNCLNIQDEKVIANSVSLLNPSDVMKLLDALISVIHHRGAGVVRVLPWLKSLLLQHASVIASQQSSFLALNSLYQLIEARVSNYQSAVQLSSSLNFLFGEAVYESLEADEAVTPVIYEDKDDSDEEEESDDDAMETDDAASEGNKSEDGDSSEDEEDGDDDDIMGL